MVATSISQPGGLDKSSSIRTSCFQRVPSLLLGMLVCAPIVALGELADNDVQATISENGNVGMVSFAHRGNHHHYRMHAYNVFADDAEITEHSENGSTYVQIPPTRTFRSLENGVQAVATVHLDGSVSGFFEHNRTLIKVHPVDEQSIELRTGAQKHAIEFFEPLKVFGKMTHDGVFAKRRLYWVPEVVEESSDADFEAVSDQPSDELPQASHDSEHAIAAMEHWAGQAWYPGCYDGDKDLHKASIGIIIDTKAFEKHKNYMDVIPAAVSQASFIYEMQMHIRLSIKNIKVYKHQNSAPNFANGCPQNLLKTKLEALKKESTKLPKMAAWHLFTGCGKDHGEVGLAYVGGLCTKGYNTGVSQIHDRKASNQTFLTFAHELGHNFGADHSFENGQGKTGGIMDYGDGHYLGVYQFNSKFRKAQVCKNLQQRVHMCGDNFKLLSDPRPTETPPNPEGCVTVSSSGVGAGQPCAFPFKFKDITYEGCTPEDHTAIWCATEVNSAGEMIDGKWGQCPWNPVCIGKDSPCMTVGEHGVGAGHECIFPFHSLGVEYSTCTYVRIDLFNAGGMWCATKVDHEGTMEKWGECDSTDYCVNQWKTVGWYGVPPAIATEYGSQAIHWLDDKKEEVKHKVTDTKNALYDNTIGRVIRFFTDLWDSITSFPRNTWNKITGQTPAEETDAGSSSHSRLYEVHATVPFLERPRWRFGGVTLICGLFVGAMSVSIFRAWRWEEHLTVHPNPASIEHEEELGLE